MSQLLTNFLMSHKQQMTRVVKLLILSDLLNSEMSHWKDTKRKWFRRTASCLYQNLISRIWLQDFLISYLVLKIMFWLKQDAVLLNCFHFVFFQIVKSIYFFSLKTFDSLLLNMYMVCSLSRLFMNKITCFSCVQSLRDGVCASFSIGQWITVVNFISLAAMELMLALICVSRKQMNFMMMLLFILLIGSTQYKPILNYT